MITHPTHAHTDQSPTKTRSKPFHILGATKGDRKKNSEWYFKPTCLSHTSFNEQMLNHANRTSSSTNRARGFCSLMK